MSDNISRQAAVDALGEAPEVWTESPEEFAALNQWEMDVTAIKAVPPATCDDCIWNVCNYNKVDWDVEPKTGKWIKAIGNREDSSKFCPNCGAKMVREDGE